MSSLFLIYICALFLLAAVTLLRKTSYSDFIAAGQRCGTFSVFMTLMATMIGASATLGIAESAEVVGISASLWLTAGAVGLLLQGIFLTERIRKTDARTLPEMALLRVGKRAQRLVASVIAISWPAVIAAQMTALASVVEGAFGIGEQCNTLLLVASLITLYTMVGGQSSIIKTDALQMIFLIVGFAAIFIFIFMSGAAEGADEAELCLKGSTLGIWDFVGLLPIVGGAYLIGPDIASRSFAAKNPCVARRAIIAVVPFFVLFGLGVAFAGAWCGQNIPGSENPILRIASRMPEAASALLVLGLSAALFSSADTCLINCSAIITNDLLNKKSVWVTRVVVLLLGVLSFSLACFGEGIIGLLMIAYSIYTPGIVIPLICALVRDNINEKRWLLAVGVGGLCGVVGAAFCNNTIATLAGMILSLLIILCPMRKTAAQATQ